MSEWYVFDLLEMERPHRSGVLAVLLAYAALFGFGAVNGYYGDDGRFSVICLMFPWECMREDTVQKQEPKKEYQVTPLYYAGFGKLEDLKKDEMCHLDYLTPGGRIMHFARPEEVFKCATSPGSDWRVVTGFPASFFVQGNRVVVLPQDSLWRVHGPEQIK